MAGDIYLMREGGGLLPMSEQRYDSEDMLQGFLEDYPALLAGEQMTDGDPRRWLLVSRELPVSADHNAPSWYVDHLFLDQDGVPTLVEVKRSTDTRIRREVVGQILDYAANAAVRWSAEQLRARLDSTPDGSRRLLDFLNDADAEDFWGRVAVNLAAGRIRMVFVADSIPPELRRVVDFLAAQLRTAEVFAVEVRNYLGIGERAFVPRLVSTPKSTPPAANERQWDERSFFEELSRRNSQGAKVAKDLIEWARLNMTDFWYGKGATAGSCIPRLALANSRLYLFALWTYGTIEMQFQHMRTPPFNDENRRLELIDKLNRISGIAIPRDGARRRPTFDMSALSSERERNQFLETMEWAIDQVRAESKNESVGKRDS
jgi:hypothetical protein